MPDLHVPYSFVTLDRTFPRTFPLISHRPYADSCIREVLQFFTKPSAATMVSVISLRSIFSLCDLRTAMSSGPVVSHHVFLCKVNKVDSFEVGEHALGFD